MTGYAHVNGKRTVYIPVTKRSDASTLAVIDRVKTALPAMQAVVPEDVKISLEFDQSRYVVDAIRSLVNEGVLGAVLTGLVVLLFLRDWRSALIVITTIPIALLSAVVMLWAFGQTINIMTLGGLALAVGVLVDEATVEIENIHTHMQAGLSAAAKRCSRRPARRRWPDFCRCCAFLSVFVPSLFMAGVARQLFVPLSLAVGFAMMASYVLSSSMVPVLSVWLMRERGPARTTGSSRLRTTTAVPWIAFLACDGLSSWAIGGCRRCRFGCWSRNWERSCSRPRIQISFRSGCELQREPGSSGRKWWRFERWM